MSEPISVKPQSMRCRGIQRSTAELTKEQANARLDAPTDAEYATFTDLDIIYTEKFGFPSMIAVCDLDRIGILAAFNCLIESDRETGFAEACGQDERIAELRLMEVLPI